MPAALDFEPISQNGIHLSRQLIQIRLRRSHFLRYRCGWDSFLTDGAPSLRSLHCNVSISARLLVATIARHLRCRRYGWSRHLNGGRRTRHTLSRCNLWRRQPAGQRFPRRRQTIPRIVCCPACLSQLRWRKRRGWQWRHSMVRWIIDLAPSTTRHHRSTHLPQATRKGWPYSIRCPRPRHLPHLALDLQSQRFFVCPGEILRRSLCTGRRLISGSQDGRDEAWIALACHVRQFVGEQSQCLRGIACVAARQFYSVTHRHSIGVVGIGESRRLRITMYLYACRVNAHQWPQEAPRLRRELLRLSWLYRSRCLRHFRRARNGLYRSRSLCRCRHIRNPWHST